MPPSGEEFPKANRKKPSEKKIHANRDNATKSTGPKDTRRTRHNASRHGLLADGISELDFLAGHNEVLQKLIEEKAPVGETETHLVERIAFYMIRIRRARLLETDMLNSIDHLVLPALYERSGKPKVRTQRTLMETLVRTYQRYETIFSAKLIKALRELERVQQQSRSEASTDIEYQIDGGEDKDLEPATFDDSGSP